MLWDDRNQKQIEILKKAKGLEIEYTITCTGCGAVKTKRVYNINQKFKDENEYNDWFDKFTDTIVDDELPPCFDDHETFNFDVYAVLDDGKEIYIDCMNE